MPYMPDIPSVNVTTIPTTTFYGLNRSLVTSEGEMEDMTNLCSDHFPVIATRLRRKTPAFAGVEGGGHVNCTNPQGLLGTDKLIMADDGKLYADGVEIPGVTLSTEETMQPKHMVSMGAYVLIWPDKVYVNMANPDDHGSMGKKWTAETDAVISAMMTRKDGRDYDAEEITVSATAPGEPADKQLWLDTSGEKDVLKQYSEIYAEWIQVATTYIKIQADGIGEGLKEGDTIFLSGAAQWSEATPAAEEETAAFPTEDVQLRSTFSTVLKNGSYVSTTPTIAERTKTITVSGIPEGAKITGATLRLTAGRTTFGEKLLTVNGENIVFGENSIPVQVTGNGDVSLLFRFQSYNYASTEGSHSGKITISDVVLEVTWGESGGTDEKLAKQLDSLNTSNMIYAAGDDYIIVAGIIRSNATMANTLTAELRIPDLDYITESNNRLWGCSYSKQDGTLTNEIMSCALGDFRNWYRYEGTSMDSYAVSIGSDGKFTGACTVRGNPIFFKENCLHKIQGTEPSNFSLSTTVCRGVQEGCWRSLAMVNEILYYKSRTDVMAYDGSMPYAIGEKLGKSRWYEASGAAYMDKYYLCMHTEDIEWSMYVYDTIRQLWHREDDSVARHMSSVNGDLYMIRENGSPALVCIGGGSGETEEPFEWMAKFGVSGVTDADQKYVSRFNIRAQLAARSSVTLQIQYDSDGVWHRMGTMQTPIMRTFLLPVVPRRCDHFQVMLTGKGDAKILSISKSYEGGGDGGYGAVSRSANA